MPSSHLILWCPLLLLPSIFPSIRNFSNESAVRVRWPKYCSFSISISPSNKYSGLISLKMDWFDLLAVQGTLRSLLQHHSSKASILQHPPSLRFSSHNCMWLKKKMYTTKLKNNTVGKTVPVDLLDTGLPWTFKFLRNKLSAKHNKVECSKIRSACVGQEAWVAGKV